MKLNKINNKGFTLVELLAVIVVLAIVMGLAVVGISSVLDSTRKNAFASDAKSYVEGARALVRADEANVLMGGTSTHTPKCNQGKTTDSVTFSVSDVKLDSGGKSPFTNTDYVVAASGAAVTSGSYIKVTCNWTDNSYAKYSYEVYLTDGTWHVGPLNVDQVSGDKVTSG